eukprot:TRINITY_DN5831_c0_g2_i1.p1 TRINITY_DN5831_c0_g2~~TRINITY_DN5831_c0_g2_i1.p1  ORF type:complete len:346 (+),score=92.56 TRINITY_DN5831_c0_g2_i1:96-1133(+)
MAGITPSIESLKSLVGTLSSTDPSDTATIGQIALQISVTASQLHRSCTAPQVTSSPQKVTKKSPVKKAAPMKGLPKKELSSDDEEDTSGDIDDNNDDSASESEDDSSNGEDGSDGAGSDDSEEAPKKRKAPAKKRVVAKKSARPKRPADAPKRPMSAYMIFCSDRRDQFRQSMPTATFVDIAKAMGEAWMKMSAEEKEVYQRKAAEAAEQYRKAMDAYEGAQETKLPLFDSKEDKKNADKKTPVKKVESSSEEDSGDDEDKKPRKQKRDPSAPKRPMTPYLIFAIDNRASILKENPELRIMEVSRTLAERWKGMADAEKMPYVEKALADKVRYEKEMAVYMNKQN